MSGESRLDRRDGPAEATPEGETRAAEMGDDERRGLVTKLAGGTSRDGPCAVPFAGPRADRWASSECLRLVVLLTDDRREWTSSEAPKSGGSLGAAVAENVVASGVGGVLMTVDGWPEMTHILPASASTTDRGGLLPRRTEGETGEVSGLPSAEATFCPRLRRASARF